MLDRYVTIPGHTQIAKKVRLRLLFSLLFLALLLENTIIMHCLFSLPFHSETNTVAHRHTMRRQRISHAGVKVSTLLESRRCHSNVSDVLDLRRSLELCRSIANDLRFRLGDVRVDGFFAFSFGIFAGDKSVCSDSWVFQLWFLG